MAESANEKGLENQAAGSVHEADPLEEAAQQSPTEQHGHSQEEGDDQPEDLRRSERARHPTEKMRVLQEDDAKKREKRLFSMYEKWKIQIRKAREQLKTYMSEGELWVLIDELKKTKEAIMNMYLDIRDLTTPSTDIRRRVDTCESVSKEIISIAYDRAVDNEDEFE